LSLQALNIYAKVQERDMICDIHIKMRSRMRRYHKELEVLVILVRLATELDHPLASIFGDLLLHQRLQVGANLLFDVLYNDCLTHVDGQFNLFLELVVGLRGNLKLPSAIKLILQPGDTLHLWVNQQAKPLCLFHDQSIID